MLNMPKISHRQRQIKQINNLLKTLMNEYSTSTNKAITKVLDKEIDELLELIQAIELDRYLTIREKLSNYYLNR